MDKELHLATCQKLLAQGEYGLLEDIHLLKASRLFDPDFYLSRYPSVAQDGVDPYYHYALYGWRDGLEPSREFSCQKYLQANPDLDGKLMSPLVHYLRYGRNEGRCITVAPVTDNVYNEIRRLENARKEKSGAQVGARAASVPKPFPLTSSEVKFSVLVPLYNTPEKFLREMIESVSRQTYGNWQLVLADGSEKGYEYVEGVCRGFAAHDPRVCYRRLEKNVGISENTNACAAWADGDYLCLLDHDDLLMPNALEENARMIAATGADVLYSDEDHLSETGAHINPLFKPDWSPDLLMSQMYMGHLFVFRRALFEQVGGFRNEFDGAQDYDLAFRLTEATKMVAHIPLVLYSWRESPQSTAANASSKPYADEAGRRAVEAHAQRVYGSTARVRCGENLFTYEARFDRADNPLVSIIIPIKDKCELTQACVDSILSKTSYKNYELLILDNRSELEDTKAWLRTLPGRDPRLRVEAADFEFNWSKLNNFGVSRAKGNVFVFLNNDTLVLSEDWLERLVENCLRPDIGFVGAHLRYEDGTIQHAGVVVGFGGWADHVFKGMQPIHFGAPFVSPMVSRNVLAVTGACMAVSRKTLDRIGLFDEEFIICGSDVEICVRAYRAGLFNRYDAMVRLCHLESKSRDAHIPEVDFRKSEICYAPYVRNNDPFYNSNLALDSVVPKKRDDAPLVVDLKALCDRSVALGPACRKSLARTYAIPGGRYAIAETTPLIPRRTDRQGLRLNLLIPSVLKEHCFGGIATALRFFDELRKKCGCASRIISIDAVFDPERAVDLAEYATVSAEDDSSAHAQVLPYAERIGRTFPVGAEDVFITTAWWSAYLTQSVIEWQALTYGQHFRPMIYLIQDFEPGFYEWSSRYMMADSTYRSDIPVIAAFNSKLLHDYVMGMGYVFYKSYAFDPMLNPVLLDSLRKTTKSIYKDKVIVFYGRPSVKRNAFELVLDALRIWSQIQIGADEWTVLSIGEPHGDICIGDGLYVHAKGKMSLLEYASVLREAYVGISLMVSPHPSYPPLEMASFGVRTIVNRYGSKDLSSFSENIVSLESCSPHAIAIALKAICDAYPQRPNFKVDPSYIEDRPEFGNIPDKIALELANA